MNRIFWGTIIPLFIGFTILAPLQGFGAIEGKSIPVITQSFASPQLIPGDTWKIYLNVSDPNGKMKYILAMVDQAGVGPYPVSFIRIKKGNQKEMSGYIYLNSFHFAEVPNSLNNTTLNLTVQIKDSAGNYSNPVVFPLYINTRADEETPPNGIFQERDLGPVMIDLQSITGGRGFHEF